MYDIIQEQEVKARVLELVKKRISMEVGREFASNLTIDARVNYMTDYFVYTLRALLTKQPVDSIVREVRKVPASWWQAFRARFLPRWWRKRFPVKWVDIPIVLVHEHYCPHLAVDRSDEHLHFLDGAGCAKE